MSVKVDREIKVRELPPAEHDLLMAMRDAVNAALAEGVDPNHVLSLIGGLMVKSALQMGLPRDRLSDLVDGIRLTVEHEQSDPAGLPS